jgi:hypothetical protein
MAPNGRAVLGVFAIAVALASLHCGTNAAVSGDDAEVRDSGASSDGSNDAPPDDTAPADQYGPLNDSAPADASDAQQVYSSVDAPSDGTEPRVDSASPDATDANSSFGCDGLVCGVGQVCVHPCCGGSAPPCNARPDGGACPSGWQAVTACPAMHVPGCQAPACTPPPAFCVTPPAACQSDAACGCLDSACQGACGTFSGREVMCVCG